jgi:tetratricopeptide (TPR) repeat protein
MHANIFAQSQTQYADALMAEQDYFRAISEYKRVFHFSADTTLRNTCLLKISKAYLKSNKFKAAIQFSGRLLNQSGVSIHQSNKAYNYIGLSYYGLKVFGMAKHYFNKTLSSDTTGFTPFYLALLDAEKGEFQLAGDKFYGVHQRYPYSEISELSRQLSGEIVNGYNVKRKNSFLAALMSALLPGTGQIYCNHYYDGIQAFMYVGAFAFATYAAYKYDKHCHNNFVHTYIAAGITSLFHIGNIIGAQRTAAYYNMVQKQKFMDQIREKVFSVDY